MEELVTLRINGIEVHAPRGKTILNAALDAGIYIPHLCYHPDLRPHEACKLCIVELRPSGRIVSSCATPVEDGMDVVVNSEKADHLRRLALELIFTTHPADCSSCPKYSNCELQSIAQYLGVRDARLYRVDGGKSTDDRNPLFVRDTKRCIQCGRCVRACQELRGVKVMTYLHDENGSSVGVRDNLLMGDAGCKFCGACVAVCPTGALRDKEGVFRTDVPWNSAVVPCQNACPAHIDIPAFLRKIKNGKPEEAASVIRERVPFPHCLGMVCIGFCEDDCRRGKVNESISVCRLKRYSAEHDSKEWKQRRRIEPNTGKSVAVIGGGPTGLTAAYYLRKQGHAVTIFERQEELGGQMRFGLPEHRLPKSILRNEIEDILDVGIDVKLGAEIRDPSALKSEYDAVLLATGTSIGTKLPLDGAEAPNVYAALELLGRANRGESLEKVVSAFIIGGGNVAFDIARTLLRSGVKEVNLACLEPRDRMTSTEEEIGEGIQEGVQLHPGTSFVRILKDDSGRACGVETRKVIKFEFDESGRLSLETEEESTIIPADMVVFAVGQRAELFDAEAGIEQGKANVVITESADSCRVQGHENMFAAGDAVTGTKYVVWAVAAGRKVAEEIDAFLGGNGCISEKLVEKEPAVPYIGREEGFYKRERHFEHMHDPEDRLCNSEPVSEPFCDCDASEESSRCFQCDLRRNISKVRFWSAYSRENSVVSEEVD